MTAVSYTHLDVYKRQILERINGAPEAEVEAQSIRRSLHGTVKAKLFSYGVGVIVIGM